MYNFLRFLLFLLPAELSHGVALGGLKLLHSLGLAALLKARVPDDPLELFGVRFPNPVGLAAGLDKNGDYLDALGALGFGFIELGTVTPRPQPGNDKPRLFRLASHRAIINRMGFNNKGLDHMVGRLRRRRFRGVVGVNIGKNLSTPVENALDDYLQCLRGVHPHADYIVVNLSSPNTPGLRELQFGEHLDRLLGGLKAEQEQLARRESRHVPLLVKIAPDLEDEEVGRIAAALLAHGIEGVIATNTTVARAGVEDSSHGMEAGGLSGEPLADQSTRVIAALHRALQGRLPIIGVGGIVDGAGAAAKIRAGASLVQLYSGVIFRGPALIGEAARAVSAERAPV